MTYHAPTNQFTVPASDLQRVCHSLRWAIKNIREGHGLDLGADRPGKLDVSNE